MAGTKSFFPLAGENKCNEKSKKILCWLHSQSSGGSVSISGQNVHSSRILTVQEVWIRGRQTNVRLYLD
jgi:hypothetical protein